MDNSFAAIAIASVWLAQPAFAAETSAPQPVAFDANRLREGRFTYQLTSNGKNLGLSIIEIRAESSDSFLIRMEAPEVEQRWSARVARAFTPFSAELEMSGSASPYRMSLRYSETEVSGTEFKKGSSHAVATAIQRQVVDQRVDWAAMMAAQFRANESIEFDVYDPGTGFSRLVGKSALTKPVANALGKVPTIRLDYAIHKSDHTESYTVYATKAEPRVMLREDMPNGLVALLVAVDD